MMTAIMGMIKIMSYLIVHNEWNNRFVFSTPIFFLVII